ncbi:MAG TPA: efflux RND transporter permease subunit, partial [Methylobacter sp.]
MLNSIIDASLRYKLLVIILFIVVAGLGIRAWKKVPVDAFPDVTPIQVNVYTESPGLASEDVEQLLSFPIESALAGLPKVQEIRSISLFGLSYVAVYFEDNMDIYFARRLVAERLQEVSGRLPAGYGVPEMGPNTSGLGQVFWYTVERAEEKLEAAKLKSSDTLKSDESKDLASDMDLRTLQDWSIRLILRTAPGVDDVMSWGGQERQYQIVLDPQAFAKYGLTFKEVLETVGVNNRQVGGQYVDIGQEQFLVRGLGLIKNETELGQIVVKTVNGTPVYLRDIAKIQQG